MEIVNEETVYESTKGSAQLLANTKAFIVNGSTQDGLMVFNTMQQARDLAYLLTNPDRLTAFDEIKGCGKNLEQVKSIARRIAAGSSTVLITGESGTGKELFARAIHYSSRRKDKPFIIVNCGAIPDTLLESELFGYEDGAFTGAKKEGRAGKFEIANGGTIFLDEIGDLPLNLQVKLLHVLQRRKIERVGGTRLLDIDIRVIAATHRDLEAMCSSGEFREDLYYRLNVIPLRIPPLRERQEDIKILMEYFLGEYSRLLSMNISGFTNDVQRLFLNYDWPGNIRELENAIECAVNLEVSDLITVASIPSTIKDSKYKRVLDYKNIDTSLRHTLWEIEKDIINYYYGKLRSGTISMERVTNILGISRSTFYNKLSKLKSDEKQLSIA